MAGFLERGAVGYVGEHLLDEACIVVVFEEGLVGGAGGACFGVCFYGAEV